MGTSTLSRENTKELQNQAVNLVDSLVNTSIPNDPKFYIWSNLLERAKTGDPHCTYIVDMVRSGIPLKSFLGNYMLFNNSDSNNGSGGSHR